MQAESGRIAFFDSGIGGLTVLRACAPMLNNYIYYYYGDVYRAPYGNLDEKTIYAYTKEVFDIFSFLNVNAAVVACNTVTAVCIERLRKEYAFPIVGAEPAVLVAAREGGEVFVLTTRATYQSERFSNLLRLARSKYPNTKITPFSCDGLAGAIERGEKDFTPYLPRGKPNKVVLGCTHYVFIKDFISKFYGAETVDGNQGIANRLKSLLKGENSVLADHLKPQSPKNSLFLPKTDENPLSVCFLGEGKMVTKTKYEQMFASK